MNCYPVFNLPVFADGLAAAAGRMVDAAAEGRSAYACVCNVHMAMETRDDPAFAEVVKSADWVVPDGMPLVWVARLQGVPVGRVRGFDLTLACCDLAARRGIPVGFFGGSEAALAGAVRAVRERFPELQVAYAFSPPMRPPTDAETAAQETAFAASGARLLFVGLGCPKQEKWMHARRGRVPAVMLGVGAVFDFLAGTKPHAPRWMQACGLEWLFRWCCEPRRLAARYLRHNPRFVLYLVRLWLAARRKPG